jgi:uncharacterized membrane-anchored protein
MATAKIISSEEVNGVMTIAVCIENGSESPDPDRIGEFMSVNVEYILNISVTNQGVRKSDADIEKEVEDTIKAIIKKEKKPEKIRHNFNKSFQV